MDPLPLGLALLAGAAIGGGAGILWGALQRAQAERRLAEAREEFASERAELKATAASALAREEERGRTLASREATLLDREERIRQRESELGEISAKTEAELARIASLSPDEARELVIAEVASEAQSLAELRAGEALRDAEARVEARSREILLTTIERTASDGVITATATVVALPSEDMKGRIIGREGRNIRAFETITGTDLLIDETPEAVTISSFDPIRRETARLTLLNLMLDGRIHPAKIEEHHERAKEEVDRAIREAADDAADRAGVMGLAPGVLALLGRLRFRTSYAQNVLDHSVEAARIAAKLAGELGFDVELARRAALLHDIGKAIETDDPHAAAGAAFLASAGEAEAIVHAVAAHHREIEPLTPEALLVIAADTISASRPGARRESLEAYTKRLAELEALALAFKGVQAVYAMQAGRELRVFVRSEEVSDVQSARMANEIARRIEAELSTPTPIRITVIRESRATATTRNPRNGTSPGKSS